MRLFKAEKGHSIVETLISTLIGGIILTGAFQLYTETAKGTQGQTNTVDLQMQVKAAVDFMVHELRLTYGQATISTTLTANDTLSFQRVEASGFSSGGNTSTTLWDTSKSWQTNQYAPGTTGPYTLSIDSGTSAGETHSIGSNNGIALTLGNNESWSTIPDSSSLYYIYRTKVFTRTADNKLRYQIGSGGFNPIAENITSLSFSQPDPASVEITVVGRTSTPDPRTGAYSYYSLTDTARKRN